MWFSAWFLALAANGGKTAVLPLGGDGVRKLMCKAVACRGQAAVVAQSQ